MKRTMLLLPCVLLLTGAAPVPYDSGPSFNGLIVELRQNSLDAPRPIDLTAVGDTWRNLPILRFRMRNTSSEVVSIPRPNLPWGSPDRCLNVIALLPTHRYVLPSVCIPFYSGPPGNFSLAPGESASDFYAIFPSRWPAGSVPTDTDVVVLWTYRLPVGDMPKAGWPTYSGVATIRIPRAAAKGSN